MTCQITAFALAYNLKPFLLATALVIFSGAVELHSYLYSVATRA